MGLQDDFITKFEDRFIWNEEIKDCIRNSGFVFSDWDMAAIIYNSEVVSLFERRAYLAMLQDITADEELKEQINDRLAYDDEAVHILKNDDTGFFYATSVFIDNGFETIGYYACYRDAEIRLEEYLKNRTMPKSDSDKPDKMAALGKVCKSVGKVEKYQIIGHTGESRPVICPRAILSEQVEPDKSKRVRHTDYEGEPVSSAIYNELGEIMDYWTNETPDDVAAVVEAISPRRFEHHFTAYPTPFKKGDVVRVVGSEETGIVSADCQEWEGMRRRSENGVHMDLLDFSVMVDYADGNHDHICPLMLELIDSNTR